jgi:hypothetical protein
MRRRQEPPELVIDGMGGRARAILNASAEIIYWETSGIVDSTMTTALTHRLNTGRILALGKARQRAGGEPRMCAIHSPKCLCSSLPGALTLRAPRCCLALIRAKPLTALGLQGFQPYGWKKFLCCDQSQQDITIERQGGVSPPLL